MAMLVCLTGRVGTWSAFPSRSARREDCFRVGTVRIQVPVTRRIRTGHLLRRVRPVGGWLWQFPSTFFAVRDGHLSPPLLLLTRQSHPAPPIRPLPSPYHEASEIRHPRKQMMRNMTKNPESAFLWSGASGTEDVYGPSGLEKAKHPVRTGGGVEGESVRMERKRAWSEQALYQ